MAVIIDAKDMLLGRLASCAAKRALAGEDVIIINAEKACVSGRRENILAEYKRTRERGGYYHGPNFPRMPDRLVRRTIRGMLPWHKDKGRRAFRRVKVYIGCPPGVEQLGKLLDIKKEAGVQRLKNPRFVRIEEISKELGAKW